ncbi:hypothetical protein HDU67_002527, partial [Dinochytrium kinnereticum]
MIFKQPRLLLGVLLLLAVALCLQLTVVQAVPTEEELMQDKFNAEERRKNVQESICNDKLDEKCAAKAEEIKEARERSKTAPEREDRKKAAKDVKSLTKEKAELEMEKKTRLASVNKDEKAVMQDIGVAVHVPDKQRDALIRDGTPELQHNRGMGVVDAIGGADVGNNGALLAGTRPQTQEVYDEVRHKINYGEQLPNVPPGVNIDSISALESVTKDENKKTGGRTQGNINAVIDVNGEKLGVIIHCDIITRRSIEALEANTNPRLIGTLKRRAAAGSEECKKAHAKKVSGNMKDLFKGQVKNADGSINVK